MADIFISYASEDRDRIKPLVELLENEGWSVWWDRDLVAGPSFNEKIQEALDAATCIIVAWSTSAVRSTWCRDEAMEGLESGRLVPLRIDDARPPLGFRSAQTASLVGWPDSRGEIDALLGGIRERIRDSLSSEQTRRAKSIAVLPFVNLSSDPEQEYFCDGLTDDLIDILVRGTELKVIARTSSFQFKDTAKDVRDIGKQLGVTHIVEGSVRRSGDRMRVATQLVRTDDGSNEWSDRYDRRVEDIFALQEEIAEKLAGELNAKLSGFDQNATPDPEAHILVLHAKHLLDLGGDPSVVMRAHNLLKEALEIDPDNVDACMGVHRSYGQLAAVLMRQASSESDGSAVGITLEDCDRLAAESLKRALLIDPANTRANSLRAWASFLRGDKAEASRRFKLVMSRSSIDQELLHSLVRPLIWSCRSEDAIVVSEKLLRRDPLNVIAIANFALAHFCVGRIDESETQIRRALALSPVERFSTWLLGTIRLMSGEPTKALNLAEQFTADSIDRYAMLVMAHHSQGNTSASQGSFSELIQRWPDSEFEIAGLHAFLGKADKAFTSLEHAVEHLLPMNRFGPVNTLIDPRWQKYHNDERWQRFLEKTNQTEGHLADFDVDISHLK